MHNVVSKSHDVHAMWVSQLSIILAKVKPICYTIHISLIANCGYYIANTTILHSVVNENHRRHNCTIQQIFVGVLSSVSVIDLLGILVIAIVLLYSAAWPASTRKQEQHFAEHSSCWDSCCIYHNLTGVQHWNIFGCDE